MIRNNLSYTVGIYNEAPEGTLSTSGPALLAQTLAWAAQNNIPFHKVILSLTKNGANNLNPVLFILPRSKKWDKCLYAARRDLEKGDTLYGTLRRRFEYFLPEYYLEAVEKAEKEGHLRETLPVFAKRLNFTLEISKYYKNALTFPFVELLIILALTSGLTTFIFPNLHKIFEGFSYRNDLIIIIYQILSMIFTVWDLIFHLIIFWVILHFFGRLFPVIRRKVLMIASEIFISIPPFSNYMRNMAMLNLASSMASYLDLGEDVLNAAKFSEKSCEYFWLKRKLKRFIIKVNQGKNWLDAWNEMELGCDVSELMIRNSAATENPAAGFDHISNWFYNKQIRSIKNNAVWFFLISTIVNAVIVFLIAFSIFKLLTQIIYALG